MFLMFLKMGARGCLSIVRHDPVKRWKLLMHQRRENNKMGMGWDFVRECWRVAEGRNDNEVIFFNSREMNLLGKGIILLGSECPFELKKMSLKRQ